MMEGLRSWLLSVIAAALLCAVAGALMPPGPVRQVGRLVCGLVLMAAVLSPLTALDVSGGQEWLAGWASSLDSRTAALEEVVEEQRKGIIERDCAAYIVDKGSELGLTCTARVECRTGEEGLCLPVRAEISGDLTQEERARLARLAAEDLGIPETQQIYIGEEGAP